jgi:transcriptional regulator with XRE-family HTH domain
MMVGERIRVVREAKKLSQGDIEKRTGLIRCYISRVENGHTVPALETLEKIARALEMPLYQLLYEGENPPEPAPRRVGTGWEYTRRGAAFVERLRKSLSKLNARDRAIILALASQLSQRQSIFRSRNKQ